MSVGCTMVGGEAGCHDGPRFDGRSDDPGSQRRRAESENCHLRRIDHAEQDIDAVIAEAGDRDRRIGELGAAQRPGANPGDEIAQSPISSSRRLAVDVMDGGCHQPAAADRHRGAEMDELARLKAIRRVAAVEAVAAAQGKGDRE